MNAAVATEFVGTALLLSAIAFAGNPALIIAAFAVAVGFGAKVSGAHINPAVTLLQQLSGKIEETRALQQVLAQLAAAATVFGLSKYV